MTGRPRRDGPEVLKGPLAVSRESRDRLGVYVDLLRRWQRRINLVGPGTLDEVWLRHVADSVQLPAFAPAGARNWVDFGSGGGFPGLVIAILLADTPGAAVHLVESDRRKASFLRTVSRETGCPAIVHTERIESFTRNWDGPVDAVSARAVAPLAVLCGYGAPLIGRGAVAVFHKGRDFCREVEEANRTWSIDLIEKPSMIDPESRVLVIRRLTARGDER